MNIHSTNEIDSVLISKGKGARRKTKCLSAPEAKIYSYHGSLGADHSVGIDLVIKLEDGSEIQIAMSQKMIQKIVELEAQTKAESLAGLHLLNG